MKTAEEWANQDEPWQLCSCECEMMQEDRIKLIKQIQLDAMKEGINLAYKAVVESAFIKDSCCETTLDDACAAIKALNEGVETLINNRNKH